MLLHNLYVSISSSFSKASRALSLQLNTINQTNPSSFLSNSISLISWWWCKERVMEQTRYWMWARNKLVAEKVPSAAHVNHEYSWEEQAFAEDSAGPHGGCIWPPRSYTCSFCRREFRSAQALGGHMNVHRRDRARLKQSPSTPQPPPHYDENNSTHQNPFTSSTSSLMGSVIHQHPSDHVRNRLVYSPLMINKPDLAVASSPNRVSAASSAQENCISTIQTLVSPLSYTSSIVHTESLSPTALARRSKPITAARFLIVSGSSNLEQEGEKLREGETAAGILRRRVRDHKLNSSAVSLNLVSFSGNRPTRSDDEEEEEEEEGESMINNKRRKTSNTTTLPFFLKANFIDRDNLKSEGIGLINKQSSMEDELDLELRLGA